MPSTCINLPKAKPGNCISPSQLSCCSVVLDTSLQSFQGRHENHSIFVNYHFRIALWSLPVPQTPKVRGCVFFLYVNVQGVEGIQKRAWGRVWGSQLDVWFGGTSPFSRGSLMTAHPRAGRWAGGRVNRIASLWIKKDKYPFGTRSARFEV